MTTETQDVTEFTKRYLQKVRRLTKEHQDRQFERFDSLVISLKFENRNQIRKWGLQKHTLAEWLMFTTEELGELAKAISEFVYRDGTPKEIYFEAIQTATLALKIAEIIELEE